MKRKFSNFYWESHLSDNICSDGHSLSFTKIGKTTLETKETQRGVLRHCPECIRDTVALRTEPVSSESTGRSPGTCIKEKKQDTPESGVHLPHLAWNHLINDTTSCLQLIFASYWWLILPYRVQYTFFLLSGLWPRSSGSPCLCITTLLVTAIS